MRSWIVGISAIALSMGAAHACVFELGDVVAPAGSGGGGAGGSSVGAQQIRIEVDGSMVTETLTRVPIMVALDGQRFDYGAARPDGGDLHFVAEDGTALNHEVEHFDPQSRSILWVELPQLSAGESAVFYLRYGGGVVAQQVPAVWAHYSAVYHFQDDPTSGVLSDRTGHGHDGDPSQLVAGQRVPGMLGFGYDFDGTANGPRVVVPMDGALDALPGEARTVELWFQRQAGAPWGGTLIQREGCCVGYTLSEAGVVGALRGWIGVGCCVDSCCGGTVESYHFPDVMLPGGDTNVDWHHLVMVLDRDLGSNAMYLDGVLQGSVPVPSTTTQVGGELYVGGALAGQGGAYHGNLDELRIAPMADSAGWIAVQHASMTDSLLSYGSPEATP